MNVIIETTYYQSSADTIDLPVQSWDEIEAWFVKWHTLHFKLKGEDEYREIELPDPNPEGLDLKRPAGVQIIESDGEGGWGDTLAEG